MNLLTLLRSNKYTQKQMAFLLDTSVGKVGHRILELERRGYIVVHRRYKVSGPVARPYMINAQNLYKVTLYRS